MVFAIVEDMDLDHALRTEGNERMCPVAAIMREGKVLMGLRHYKKDTWKPISVWTFPGGRCEAGETVEKTLRREVAEEIGVTDLAIEKYLGEVPGAKEGDIVPVFLCAMKGEPQLLEPEKFSEWKWCSLNDFPENFINPNAYELLKSALLIGGK